MRTLVAMLVILFFMTLGLACTSISMRAWMTVEPIGPHCHKAGGTVVDGHYHERQPYLCDTPDGDTVVEWRDAR